MTTDLILLSAVECFAAGFKITFNLKGSVASASGHK